MIRCQVPESKGLNYDALVAAEYCNIIKNSEPFECAICFCNIDPGSGIVLRDCLHMFCSLVALYFYIIINLLLLLLHFGCCAFLSAAAQISNHIYTVYTARVALGAVVE